MANTKKPELVERLPPTPCKPALKAKVTARSVQMNVSLAHVTREALEFFFAHVDKKSIKNAKKISDLPQSAAVVE